MLTTTLKDLEQIKSIKMDEIVQKNWRNSSPLGPTQWTMSILKTEARIGRCR